MTTSPWPTFAPLNLDYRPPLCYFKAFAFKLLLGLAKLSHFTEKVVPLLHFAI